MANERSPNPREGTLTLNAGCGAPSPFLDIDNLSKCPVSGSLVPGDLRPPALSSPCELLLPSLGSPGHRHTRLIPVTGTCISIPGAFSHTLAGTRQAKCVCTFTLPESDAHRSDGSVCVCRQQTAQLCLHLGRITPCASYTLSQSSPTAFTPVLTAVADEASGIDCFPFSVSPPPPHQPSLRFSDTGFAFKSLSQSPF